MDLIPLRCPTCGDNMTGLSNDVIFRCLTCEDTFTLAGKGFKRYKLDIVKPELQRREPLLTLPFWKFEVDYDLVGDFGSTFKRLSSIEKLQAVYVAAFFQRDIFYFGDLGLLYTQAGIAYETIDQREPLLGGSRSFEEASVYCRLFVLKTLDQKIDVTGVDVHLTIRSSQLLGVPFFDLGEKLIDGLLGVEVASVCLDDLNEMRDLLKR